MVLVSAEQAEQFAEAAEACDRRMAAALACPPALIGKQSAWGPLQRWISENIIRWMARR